MKSHSFSIKEGGAAEMSVEVLHGDSGPVILLVASTTRGANLIIRIIVKRLRLGEADAPPRVTPANASLTAAFAFAIISGSGRIK